MRINLKKRKTLVAEIGVNFRFFSKESSGRRRKERKEVWNTRKE
jgi:hypothetical protein